VRGCKRIALSSLSLGLIGGLTAGPGYELIGKLIGGLSLGLIFGLRSSRQTITNDVQIVETLSLSWRGVLKGARIGLIVGLLIGLIGGLIFGLDMGPINALTVGLGGGLIGGLIFGLIGAMFGALSRRIVETKTSPNQGIRLTLRNAVFAGLIVGLFVGLIFGLIVGLSFGLGGGLSVGLYAALWYGGLDVIQHDTLRVILYFKRYAPWNYARFLDYAAERIFLQKVGGGYIFIHRRLLEHFASLEPEQEGLSGD